MINNMSRIISITNQELALIKIIRNWFNVRYLNQESIIAIANALVSNNLDLGKIDNMDSFLRKLSTLKLKSYYRRVNSPEVQAIILSIEGALKDPSWVEQMQLIIKKYDLVLKKKTTAFALLDPSKNTLKKKNKYKYHTYELDAMWSLDFTLMNKEFYLLTVMDAATRKTIFLKRIHFLSAHSNKSKTNYGTKLQ